MSMYALAKPLAIRAATFGSLAAYVIWITLLWELSTLSFCSMPPAIQSSMVPGAPDEANAARAFGSSPSLRSCETWRATPWLWRMSICVCMKPARSRAEGTVPESDCSSRLSTSSATVAS